MLKITNSQLVASQMALTMLAATKFPSIKTVYRVGRVKRLADVAMTDYASAQQKLIDGCCAKHPSGEPIYMGEITKEVDGKPVKSHGELPEGAPPTGSFKIADEKMKAYQDGIASLGKLEVKIDADPIAFDDLGDPAESNLTGEVFARLDWLIVDKVPGPDSKDGKGKKTKV